jgi:hypothetical protein
VDVCLPFFTWRCERSLCGETWRVLTFNPGVLVLASFHMDDRARYSGDCYISTCISFQISLL